jgi:hypothetical protein
MKSKTTILQLLSFMLTGCVIFIGCKGKNVSGGSKDSESAPAVNNPRRSEPVPSTDADQLISDYQSSRHIIKTDDGTGRLVALSGFQYEFGQINEIINNNASGTTADKVEQVAFYLAFEPGKKRWHLIAYGMTPPYNVAVSGGTLLDASNTTGRLASIFDDKMSAPFPKDKAEKARSFYTDHLNNIPLNTYDKKNVFRELDGFAFTASQLNQILQKNPDHIALAIGLEYPYPDKSKIRWHIIAYGMKNGNPIGTVATGEALLPPTGLYFDKADPCPPCQ